MNVTQSLLHDCFTTLRTLLLSSSDYLAVFKYIKQVKMLNGSNYRFYTQEGVANILFTLEQKSLNEEAGTRIGIVLQQLSWDFSLLVGFDEEEWMRLYSYLIDSCNRASENPLNLNETYIVVEDNHWALVILLLEVMPVEQH